MTFDVPSAAYARFMGRYSGPLAVELADLVGVEVGQRALDVGCGAGALTTVLVDRLGAAQVCAVDPSESFVAALPELLPGVEVRRAAAERLPYPDRAFDRTLAQLVVHFMTDPVAGLAEMARVTRPGGVVAANVWDHAGAEGPLATFWRAARDVDPTAIDESSLPGTTEGDLAQLFRAAGMSAPRSARLTVRVAHPSFEEWWEPFTLGVGPAGAHVAALDADARAALRDRCRELLPAGAFTIDAVAWTAWWTRG
ncbi:MAG: class I SAM-dependent methyltransferase [Actinomycetales bacterium]|nr:class I SAM-dependent methyltransferase [Actinomycetales bacterium]